jgi:hypothetical protein
MIKLSNDETIFLDSAQIFAAFVGGYSKKGCKSNILLEMCAFLMWQIKMLENIRLCRQFEGSDIQPYS